MATRCRINFALSAYLTPAHNSERETALNISNSVDSLLKDVKCLCTKLIFVKKKWITFITIQK